MDRISKDMEANHVVNAAKLANKHRELASKDDNRRINALKALIGIYPEGPIAWKSAVAELMAIANIGGV